MKDTKEKLITCLEQYIDISIQTHYYIIGIQINVDKHYCIGLFLNLLLLMRPIIVDIYLKTLFMF